MSIIWISPLSAYLPDLLLVHIHPLIIDVGSGEILGAVLDLCPRYCIMCPFISSILSMISGPWCECVRMHVNSVMSRVYQVAEG